MRRSTSARRRSRSGRHVLIASRFLRWLKDFGEKVLVHRLSFSRSTIISILMLILLFHLADPSVRLSRSSESSAVEI
eukprot:571814-Hanusia_phi.AAC.1